MIRRHQAQLQPGTGTTAIQNASQALETPKLYTEEEVAAQLAEMRQKYGIGEFTNLSTGAAGGTGGTGGGTGGTGGGTGGTGTATNTSQYQRGQTRRMPTVTDLLAGTSSPAARGFQKAGIGLAQGLMNYNPDVLAAQGFDPEKFNRQTTGLGYGTAVGGFLEGIGETVASGLEGKVDAQNIKDAMYAQMEAYERANTQTDMGRPQDPYLEDQFMQGGGYIDSFKKGGKKKKKNKPNNPALWSRAIAAAKKKFDVYPSAYANAWAVQWYKKKGGTWRKSQDGQEVQTAPPSFSEAAKKAANQTPPIKIEEELSGRHTTGIADPLNSGTPINSELEKMSL